MAMLPALKKIRTAGEQGEYNVYCQQQQQQEYLQEEGIVCTTTCAAPATL